MASEYYKWLARDVRPEEKKELTPEEKRRNWWYYHKGYVIAGLLALLVIGDLIFDMVHAARNEPDYHVAYVGASPLSEEALAAIETAFAAVGEDLSGNGRVEVTVQAYLLSQEEPADELAAQRAQNTAMQLTMDIETAKSMIFLLEDPAFFAEQYPILVSRDPEGPLWYPCADCPALSGLPVSGLSIARRGLWKNESSDAIDGAIRLFALLTEGAAE